MLELKKNAVSKILKTRIVSGIYKAGSKLPSEIFLSEELACSRKTIRSALSELEQEKLIARIRPKGTFVLSLRKNLKSILVLTCGEQSLADPYAYVLPKLEQFAKEKDLKIEIHFIPLFKNLSFSAMKDLIKKKNIQAILLGTSFLESQDLDDMIATLKQLKIPVLIPLGHPNDFQYSGFPIMMPDERKSIQMALDYLVDLGHRNISTLCIKNPSYGIRGYLEDEYKALLSENGCVLNEKTLGYASYNDDEEIKKAVESFMLGKERASAIICFSDFFAIKVYNELKKLSFKVPDDVSVVGICGYPGGEFLAPPLTTVDYCYEEIAKMAIDAVIESFRWYGKKARGTFDIKYGNVCLIKRESVMAIKKESKEAKLL